MSKTSCLDYAFAVGKIRALEKYLIKAEVFEEALSGGLPEALRLFVEADLYGETLLHIRDSRSLEEALKTELAKLKKTIAGLCLEQSLRQLLELDSLAACAKMFAATSNVFFRDYLGYTIDLHNLKTFLRLYLLAEPPEKLARHLIYQGFLKKEVFLSAYTQDLAVLLHCLEYVHKDGLVIDYGFFLREAVELTVKEKNFVFLEKAINDFLISALEPAKYITFGPQPLLAYYFAKLNEINLIRMIILSKLNNFSPETVKQRLNAVYA